MALDDAESSSEGDSSPLQPSKGRLRYRSSRIPFCVIGFLLGLIIFGYMQWPSSKGGVQDGQDDELIDRGTVDTARLSNDWSLEELKACSFYMQKYTCAWTLEANCPDQNNGSPRKAINDDTTAYNCCCEQGYWRKSQPVAQDLMGSYWSTGEHRNILVYHQTSPEICEHILENGFRLGKGGFCGKAMYFARTPQATAGKAITAGSHGGCMLQVTLDVGKQKLVDAGRCGRWNDAHKLHSSGADSILLNVEDPHAGLGDEIIIYEPERVKSVRRIAFRCNWMCHGRCQRHWPEEGCLK